MPKKLIFFLLLPALAACAAPAPVPIRVTPSCDCTEPYKEIVAWVALERCTSAMETSELVAELVKLGRPESAWERFYFGLLNQQLGTASNWRQARDAFRATRKDTTLSPEQRSIAAMLERYNIYRLDTKKDRRDLLRDQRELEKALNRQTRENALLKDKIHAITELEADMSTRIEQEQ